MLLNSSNYFIYPPRLLLFSILAIFSSARRVIALLAFLSKMRRSDQTKEPKRARDWIVERGGEGRERELIMFTMVIIGMSRGLICGRPRYRCACAVSGSDVPIRRCTGRCSSGRLMTSWPGGVYLHRTDPVTYDPSRSRKSISGRTDYRSDIRRWSSNAFSLVQVCVSVSFWTKKHATLLCLSPSLLSPTIYSSPKSMDLQGS